MEFSFTFSYLVALIYSYRKFVQFDSGINHHTYYTTNSTDTILIIKVDALKYNAIAATAY